MDRLTKRNKNLGGLPVLVRGRALGPAYFSDKRDYKDYADALERLAQYEDAEERGELVRLPFAPPTAEEGEKDWEAAYQNIETLIPLYAEIGPVGVFGLTMLMGLRGRYLNGERTDELYEAMTEAE